MKTVFRCDASIQIGTGHVMRCLTLADALVEQGVECHFICREHSGHLVETIKQRGHQTYSLPLESDSSRHAKDGHELLAHAEWLGATQQEDARLCSSILQKLQPDWLIVDHYAIDISWEQALRPYCKSLMVIDDLADRLHDCDILLDQNFLPNYKTRYEKLTSETTHNLLGPDYALLRNEFKEMRESSMSVSANAKPQILINFGGVGNFELLSKVVLAINNIYRFQYHIVTGNMKTTEVSKLRELIINPHIRMVDYTSNMQLLMNNSDYALGACGSTVWERFCLGLNSALVEIAMNQSLLLEYLEVNDLVDNLGDYRELTTKSLFVFLNNLDLNNRKYIKRKAKIMKLVDGNGAKRVSNIITKGNEI